MTQAGTATKQKQNLGRNSAALALTTVLLANGHSPRNMPLSFVVRNIGIVDTRLRAMFNVLTDIDFVTR